MKDAFGRTQYRFGDAKVDRKEHEARRQRISDLRLGASGMRYFGDFTEAESMEAEADRLERSTR